MLPLMEYLQTREAPFLVLPHPPAQTVGETARHHGFSPDEVVSTVVVATRFGQALLVVGAGREVDRELVVMALGDGEIRFPGERELLRTYPDHEPRSIPPLGALFEAPVYVDTDVAWRTAVVFSAGRPSLAIRMLTKDLFGDDSVMIAALTRQPSEEEEPGRGEEIVVEEAGVTLIGSAAQDERTE